MKIRCQTCFAVPKPKSRYHTITLVIWLTSTGLFWFTTSLTNKINIVRFLETLYQWKKFELQCTIKSDLHAHLMMILIVEIIKFINPCRHDGELLVDSTKVSWYQLREEIRLFLDISIKVFSWSTKLRKKCVNNDFEGHYFIEKQEKIYIIEDAEGAFCTE